MSDRVDELYLQAREISDPAQRSAFLDRACQEFPEERACVDRMLTDEGEAESFFSEADAPRGDWVKAMALKPRSSDLPSADEGQIIGRYKLLKKIGEGGCGVVFEAEQSQPVRRKVALKVIKLGLDTRLVVARFEAEQQALALMDHPNIAKVLDAGATETGRPYFVMELVRGVKITDYCDENNLSTRERLSLFIKVCNAIQHAHQKGIIHRDIKPSNILVTLQDRVPVPRVIDFGIAKATEGRLTEATVFTQLHQFIGTPAYMSPEQAELTSVDIDTRSDIYSLGVLLYELLTGKTPFDTQELLPLGLDAIRKTIREKDPVRPSTKLEALKRDELTTTAKRRSADTAKLLRQLKGDLDWIVMKCLEKDRTRRYETANGVAMDIQRHLDAEPVLARPPSRFYEFQKTVKRHKFGFAATATIILVLAVGILVSTWQAKVARAATATAVEARREASARAEAERAAREESEAVSRFLIDVFQNPAPGRDGRIVTVVETIDRAAENLDADLAAQPALRARLQATLGTAYEALGLFQQAIPILEKAINYYEVRSGIEDTNTVNLRLTLMSAYVRTGHAKESLTLCEKLLSYCCKTVGTNSAAAAQAMYNLATAYRAAGRLQEALEFFKGAHEVYAKVAGPAHSRTLGAMIALAACSEDLGQWDEGQKLRGQVLVLSSNATSHQIQTSIPPAITSNSNEAPVEGGITPDEWNELKGITVVVSANPTVPTETGIVIQDREQYHLYPCPTDRWNTSPERWPEVDYRGHIRKMERTTASRPYMQLCWRVGKSNLKDVKMGEIVSGTGPLYLMPSDFKGGGNILNNTGSIRVKIVKVD